MFYFGEDASLVVKYYVDKTRKGWPEFPDCDVSEMSPKDAEEAYIHFRMAYKLAKKEGVSEKVLDALGEAILRSFRIVATTSDLLVDSVGKGKFVPLHYTIGKYREIIDEVRHPSSVDAG